MTEPEHHSSWIDSLDFEGAREVMREVGLANDEKSLARVDIEPDVIGRIHRSRRAAKPRRAAFVGSVSMSFAIVLAFLITFSMGWVGSFYWYKRAMNAELNVRYNQMDRVYSDQWFEMHKKLSRRLFENDEAQNLYDEYILGVLRETQEQIEAEKAKLNDDRESRQF